MSACPTYHLFCNATSCTRVFVPKLERMPPGGALRAGAVRAAAAAQGWQHDGRLEPNGYPASKDWCPDHRVAELEPPTPGAA